MQGMQTAGTAQRAQCGMTFSFPRRAKAEKMRHWQVFGLADKAGVRLRPTDRRFPRQAEAQCFSFCKGDGVRFRLPLRDSPGFAPDSLSAACWNHLLPQGSLPRFP
jgi:hypothetical protein